MFPAGAKETLINADSERGFLSLGFDLGYDHIKLLNNNGTYSSYTGYIAGLQLGINPVRDLSIFVQYNLGNSSGEQVTSDTMTKTETFIGAKTYTSIGLFMGGGVSYYTQSITNSQGTTQLNQYLSGFFVGYDFQLNENWTLGCSAWYKLGVIKKVDNPALLSNSYSDNVQAQFMFIWSPPSTITKYYKN